MKMINILSHDSHANINRYDCYYLHLVKKKGKKFVDLKDALKIPLLRFPSYESSSNLILPVCLVFS